MIFTVRSRLRSEGTHWGMMRRDREPMVQYSVRVAATLDERITRVRTHSGESITAYVLRALHQQITQDEADLRSQGFGEGAEEKR